MLLERSAADASLMPGMLELPLLPVDAVGGVSQRCGCGTRLRTRTSMCRCSRRGVRGIRSLMKSLVGREATLEWVRTTRLAGQPLTGLARKVLQRLDVMEVRPVVWGGPVRLEAREREAL